jgi:hypothetical protein
MDKRIGYAETDPREPDQRRDCYGIYEVSEDGSEIYVQYEGYRIGDVRYGTPLGGPGWRPPVRFKTPCSSFAVVRMFAEEG